MAEILPLRRIILTAVFLCVSLANAQWSTSTRAESTLYVCPGFFPGIVTFDDGSSIVLGALQSYIYARKLDERGYCVWPPVQIHHHDSSDITETEIIGDWGGWTSDGDGGVILFWYDHRGAYKDLSGVYQNKAIYVQGVDRFGTVRWLPTGVLVKGPQSGMKYASITNDGAGGCIIAWAESEFGFPGATGRERIRVQRISSQGTTQWERRLDSTSVRYQFLSANVNRVLTRLYVQGGFGTRILLLDGTVLTDSSIGGFGSMITENDSVLYNEISTGRTRLDSLGNIEAESRLSRLNAILDTSWTAVFWTKLETGTAFHNPLIRDGVGGAYVSHSRGGASIQVITRRFDQRGEVWPSTLITTVADIPTSGTEGHGGLLIADKSSHVWRYDSLAQPGWQNPVTMIVNPADTYFELFAPDNRGGMISVFWTTIGGIFAQHSGRNGQVGIVTGLENRTVVPQEFFLSQNFPNPFNPTTKVIYSLPRQTDVSIFVFDVLGRKVAAFSQENQMAGSHEQILDGTSWATGMYFYQLITGGRIRATKRMLLLK